MPTIHREADFRFCIYVDDHAPAHIHVKGDGEAKIQLQEADGEPFIVYDGRMSDASLRRAIRIVRERQADFLRKWVELHG